ncbi:MAG: DMT family transporter [Eubacteriales bacterium]|nr:DMT family transporter [Eubacteriales bacterium]
MKQTSRAVWYAALAAALYALNAPLSKLLLADVPPMMMAAFLYLGAGMGMLVVGLVRRSKTGAGKEISLTRKDRPYVIGMVALDIIAPILLMTGLSMTTSANASLLNNFEIVATTLIALLLFKEKISKQLWIGIGFVTLSSLLLSVEDATSFHFSLGSIFVLMACACWGLENNCTRKLSHSDPLEIVVVKGFGSGSGSLVIALCVGEKIPSLLLIPQVLLLGFVAYGLSIFFYVYAQRTLGAAKTSSYYALAPFIGVVFSLAIFRQLPTGRFWLALAMMILGTIIVTKDSMKEQAQQ